MKNNTNNKLQSNKQLETTKIYKTIILYIYHGFIKIFYF